MGIPGNRPLVSVIMPVYNVEAYLRESLDSIIGQTMSDFEFICIDDGSTDSSGSILDEYAAREPRMRVVHKTNAGASAARNDGLDLACGKYLYLCDADDVCHRNLLEVLCRKARRDNAQIVCCERESFDCATGSRMGRMCFPEWVWNVPAPFSGESIGYGLLYAFGNSTCDKLLERRFVEDGNIRFQTNVKRFALFYFTAMALALAKRISLVPFSLYRYRENRPQSLQSTRHKSPTDVLKSRRIFMEEMRRRGKFEKFELGFAVSLLRVGRSQLRNMSDPEARTSFMKELLALLAEVCGGPGFPMMDFAWLPEYAIWRDLAENGDSAQCRYDESIRFFDMQAPALLSIRERWRAFRGRFRRARAAEGHQDLRIRLDFLRRKGSGVAFEGVVFCDKKDAAEAFASLEVVAKSGNDVLRRRLAEGAVELEATPEYGALVKAWRFACEFPLPSARRTEYRLASSMPGLCLSWKKVDHSRYSPLTRFLRFSYAKTGGMLFSVRGDVLVSVPATLGAHAAAEMLLCLNLLRKHSRIAMKALALRWLVRLMRMLRRRPLWLISDRVGSADDNGRAMFEYVTSLPKTENPPECVFAISRKAPEVVQLEKFGRVVDIESFRYKLEFLLSDCIVSAYHTRVHRFPFDDRFAEYAKDLVLRPRFMLLRHGVCEKDTSRIQNRWLDDASLVVTVAKREQEAMSSAPYGYSTEEVKLTGFPRYDLLAENSQKLITFMPTWRKYLIEWDEMGRHKPSANAAESQLVRAYGELLTDSRFIARCEAAGYRLQVKAHPNLSAVLPLIKRDSRITVLPATEPYRKVFAESNLIITDYSSVAFDFAYLRKPVIYFQFDRDRYFGSVYEKGYFNFEQDGFGPVVTSVSDLKQTIVSLMENDCALQPEYRRRMDSFFAFSDRENRRRVYEAIISAADKQ